jgi:arylsulfatase A-like enzyme
MNNLFHPAIVKYVFWFFFSIFSCITLVAAFGLVLLLLRRIKLTLSLLGVGLLATVGFGSFNTEPVSDASTQGKPNIIIIGIDALRPDILGFFGAPKRTPHLDDLFENASVFSESITPIARTFPAWMSILTGVYPKKSNVRYDLEGEQDIHFDLTQTLPAILQREGYETIFSSDETRFSNIDEVYGFDRVITPPVGFNDFLVGTLNDFPMSNLIVNSQLGEFLFPYSYSNRPVFTTYDPDTYIAFLKSQLKSPRKKPLFLAVHFCLPHAPYFWGKNPAYRQSIHNYQAAVKRVDQQFNDFLSLLKQDKLLEHTILVVLSDHGEALELRGDRATDPDFFIPGKANTKKVIPRFYPPSWDKELVNQSAGHGTDILSMTQYHNVLAFRFFGLNGQVPAVIPGRVSLMDIKPTILSVLNVKYSNLSGKSLVDFLSGKKKNVPSSNDFFTESDFSPQSVRSVHPETRKVLFEGIDLFEIDPKTARLSVKKSMGDLIVSSKQFADFNGPWVLALYPQNKQRMMPILLNLETGFWTNDLSTDFAKHSPANHMLRSMKNFFGNDLTQIVNG